MVDSVITNRRRAPRMAAKADEELRGVAAAYRSEMERAASAPKGAGRKAEPVKAVQRYLGGCDRSKALRRIRRAREKGYLGGEGPGGINAALNVVRLAIKREVGQADDEQVSAARRIYDTVASGAPTFNAVIDAADKSRAS